jgi:ankyrin repeat protein
MLTRARSLLSRVFSLDAPTSQVRLDNAFDDIQDETSDENDTDNVVDDEIDNSTNGFDNDGDDGLSDSDEESGQIKGKYERQVNDYPSHMKTKTNINLPRSHEKSKQNRLISAMQVATSRCNVESMKRLLTNFDMDINHRDQYGMSYLEHAILMGSFDMVDLLIRYGCDLYQGSSIIFAFLFLSIIVLF